ncbi:MAG: hypothetical protein HYZ29_03165 [Myxococcales bacterium]|nr:hypothetical protein [Myxococcales bacterium]
MVPVRIGGWALAVGLLESCGSCPPCETKAPKAEACSVDTAASAPTAPPAGPSSAPPLAPDAAAPSPTPSASAPPTNPSPEPPAGPGGSLPEVKVAAVGLHIGGGPNDDATKAPYLRAIEKRFDEIRACYAKVDDPVKGGTFGVDLHIGKGGGSAQVKQPRTGMKGDGFRDCVIKAFEHVEFEKPKKGPTVISYSIKFTLG